MAGREALHRIRGSAKGSLTRLEKKINDRGTVLTAKMLSVYESKLYSIIQKFNDAQDKIYALPDLSDEDFEEELKEQVDFEERVIAAHITLTSPAPQGAPGTTRSTAFDRLSEEQQEIIQQIVDSIALLALSTNQNRIE